MAYVAHTLRAEGHDASEDGTGRGMPLIATALRARDGARGVDSDCTDTLVPVYAIQERAVCQNPDAGPDGAGFREGLAYTLEARQQVQAIAQPYTLAIRGRGDSHDLEYRQDGTANALLTPNGGRAGIGVGAIAFAQNQRDELRLMDVAGALAADAGMHQQTFAMQRAAVRRLTPAECEKLQGFQPDYTNVMYRGKPAADGNRYRALGNSFAVPVVRWIGQRIAVQHRLAMERP